MFQGSIPYLLKGFADKIISQWTRELQKSHGPSKDGERFLKGGFQVCKVSDHPD